MPIKSRLLGGGSGFFRRGGWKCQFYFYGRGDFSDSKNPPLQNSVEDPSK